MTEVATYGKTLPTSEGAEEMQLLRDREIKFDRAVVDLDAIDADASTRNQARLLPLHQETVEIYRAAMEAGDRFPPIVVNASKKPYVIMDGNHRLFAAKMAGYASMEMLLVRGATPAQIELFTYEANAKHGLPTTVAERVRQGIYLVSMGNQAATVAKALSIPERRLWEAVQIARIERRLQKLGLTTEGFSPGGLRRLGAVHSDNVLLPLVELAQKADLKYDDVSDMVVKINTFNTEAEQIAYVDEMRAQYQPLIESTAGGALELPRDVVRLRMASRLLRNVQQDTLTESFDRLAPEFRAVIAREVIESVSALLTAATLLKSHGTAEG